jgi:ABC-type lipoprotein export system ATPase subunit
MSGNPRGSLWNKWDLHVHTPSSIVQDYGGDNDATWEKFFTDIESLPKEFKVIGINDYVLIDGYKKVVQARQNGRMTNIALFLPVIELRLDKFGQSGNDKISCINYHVIFSDKVDHEDIEHQFLTKLSTKYKPSIDDSSEFEVWANKNSLINCGKRIQEYTPENKRSNKSDLEIGFNNFHLSIEKILQALSSSCFNSKYLTAVGKAEWEDIRFGESGQGAAEKRTIVNNVNFVFTAAKTIESAQKSKISLKNQGVKDLLLDCSDAHHFSIHPIPSVKNRIGKCFTWIKADLTFDGLKMVLKEPKERCYLGQEPDIVSRVKSNKTKYIKSISIQKIDKSSLGESWFDNVSIPFNHGLITIIGNKGNGKSALTDIIALLSNHSKGFSFLTRDKFRNPRDNKAKHFEANLTWEDGNTTSFPNLNDSFLNESATKVKYIQQDFFETVCNETDVSIQSQFGKELKDVIFSHVPYDERNNCDSLDNLISYRTNEIHENLDDLRAELKAINRKIVDLERSISDEHKQNVKNKLSEKQSELASHRQNQPSEQSKPQTNNDLQSEIEKLQEEIDSLTVSIQQSVIELTKQKNLKIQIDKAFSKLDKFERDYKNLEDDWENDCVLIELKVNDIIKLEIDEKKLEIKKELCLKKIEDITQELEVKQRQKLDSEENIKSKQETLNEPEKNYQAYLAQLLEWKNKEKILIGSYDEHESVQYYQGLLDKVQNIFPSELQDAKNKRLEKSKEIFSFIERLVNLYKELYKPVQDFIDSNDLLKHEYRLTFEVSIIINKFHDKFFEYVNQSVKGTFRGSSEGYTKLSTVIESSKFDQEDDVKTFLTEILHRLEFEDKQTDKPVKPEKQLKTTKNLEDLYDFLFALEYLEPTYSLKLSGKEIKQLSPGERGALLLIFYLLVDKSNIPIIIDQPEHNLDGESVYRLLLPCVREAKTRRQVFMVTHNPNLAVVCDAEQVIHSDIDKKNGNLVTYTSGSLENFDVNQKVINVLEGTLPAFKNRESKYQT